MIVTDWLGHEKFLDNAGVAYARQFAGAFDLSRLLRVKIMDHDRRVRYREPGWWGYCYTPTKTLAGYRISVFSCGEDYHFPQGTALWRLQQPPGYRPGAYDTHAGILKAENVVRDLAEGLVWILAHELFHYLAFTGQISADNDERNADLVAYELLWAYRDAGAPGLIAETLSGVEPGQPLAERLEYAPHRWPYTWSGAA